MTSLLAEILEGEARPGDEILLCPLADGGEGTLAAIEAAGGWSWRTATVRDPLGRPVTARWLRSDDGTRAAIEMAHLVRALAERPGGRT